MSLRKSSPGGHFVIGHFAHPAPRLAVSFSKGRSIALVSYLINLCHNFLFFAAAARCGYEQSESGSDDIFDFHCNLLFVFDCKGTVIFRYFDFTKYFTIFTFCINHSSTYKIKCNFAE